jgi:hypothetical protein
MNENGISERFKFLSCLVHLLVVLILVCDCGLSMSASAPKSDSQPSGSKGLPSPTSTAGNMDSMRVLWTVSAYKIGKNAVWGEQEARGLLFKPLDIGDTSITFDRKTCTNITFKREVLNTAEYLRTKYHTDRQTLGVECETVELIKTNCTLPGFAEYMRLQDRRLVIYINGVFFFFSPAVNY